jgi:hypothetical protein
LTAATASPSAAVPAPGWPCSRSQRRPLWPSPPATPSLGQVVRLARSALGTSTVPS